MKNIYKILSITAFMFLAQSCKDDVVDIKQPGRLSAEAAFQTVSDLEAGVLGVYNNFDYTPHIQFNAIFTDELSIGVDNGGQGIGDGTYGFVLNPGSAVATALWNQYYDAINAATRVILAAETIEPDGDDETARYNDALGQAYALRAWAHFELQAYFSEDLSNDNALGAIAIDFIPELTSQLPRNTNAEVWALVESDITQAEGLITTESSPTFISQDFLKALQARMYTYRGDYTQADQFAADLLADYELSEPAEYIDMFTDDAVGEVIFKLERALGDPYDVQGATGSAFAGGWAGANFAFVNPTIDGSPYFEMGRSLYNLFDESSSRYAVCVHPTSLISEDYQASTDFAGEDILVIGKYPGSEGQPLMNDLKVFRASEMLLIRAEAAADAGNYAQASTYIGELRSARLGSSVGGPSVNTEAATFAAILDERRVELAFEGHRWLDLGRLGERANQGVTRDPLDCAINGACSLDADDYRFRLPIPLIEIDANTVIAEQQNPGY